MANKIIFEGEAYIDRFHQPYFNHDKRGAVLDIAFITGRDDLGIKTGDTIIIKIEKRELTKP